MSGFLRVVGTLSALCSVVGWFVAGNELGFWPLFPAAITGIVGGVALAAFGTMLEHLHVIRSESEKQTKLLEEVVAGSRPVPGQTYQVPQQRDEGLGKLNFKLRDV